MTLQEPNPSGLPKSEVSEIDGTRFEQDILLEEFFQELRTKVIIAKKRRFETAQEADVAAYEFMIANNESLQMQSGRRDIQVVVTGEGVYEPDVEFQKNAISDVKTELRVEFNTEDGYRPVPSFDTRAGFIEMVYALGDEEVDEEGRPTGQYLIDVRYIIRAGVPTTKNAETVNAPFQAMFLQLWPAYVAQVDRADIQSQALHVHRQEQAFYSEVSRTGLLQTRFYKQLRVLQESLRRLGNPSDYVSLPDIDNLKRVARLGGIISKNNPELAELVKDTMFRLLPIGKPLQIAGSGFIPRGSDEPIPVMGEVYGALWDIQLPDSVDDLTEPSIVLENQTGKNSTQMHVFAFEDITDLKV